MIGNLAKDYDLTMLMATHEMRFAREISDRVVVFDHGRLGEEYAPEDLFTTPVEDRTRECLGSVPKED